jgi:GMP synthase (glutamine-hydrolysing)
MSRLQIGLLQCGYIAPDVAAGHGDYPEAFAELLGPHEVDLITYDVQTGPVPTDPDAHDGWLVSGSANSAYEPLPWIAPTEAFLRQLIEVEAPLVAVCFGHQLLAQAMGGKVERSANGWGVGVHRYELLDRTSPWMDPPALGGRIRLIASHQDQVTALPAGAKVIAKTEHCKVAAYTLGRRALAVQPHPEFSAEVSRALIDLRRDAIGAERADAALASLDQPLDDDRRLMASWMAAFWRQ